MPARNCITGKTFGRIFVRSDECCRKNSTGKIERMADGLCSCGTPVLVTHASLVTGNTTSCGCYQKEWSKTKHSTHGMSNTLTYRKWRGSIDRCFNPLATAFHKYGAKGTTMCLGWRQSYQSFFDDLGECPSGKTIDRWPDKFGHYTCGHCEDCLQHGWKFNCRWATELEQARNRTNNRVFTVRGFTGCITELSEHFGVKARMVQDRLSYGWTIEKALFHPRKIIEGRG